MINYWILFLAVSIGGALGAAFRLAIKLLIQPDDVTSIPWGTLTANMIGCFFMGLLGGWIASKGDGVVPVWLIAGISTGFLGSLTTFSSFQFESFQQFSAGYVMTSVVYAVISLVLGYFLIFAGYRLSTQLF